jgi:hypothetical protein
MTTRKNRLLAAGAVLGLTFWLTACGDDDTVDDGKIGDVTTTTTTATTTTGAEPQYFAGSEHIGETVTVTAPVQDDLTGESVVLDASAYGDDSLLVLSKGEQQEYTEGQVLTVTGTVRQFSYDDYAEEYGLAESALFELYADEEFLTAESITVESPSPTS